VVVTSFHIVLIFGYTLIIILFDNVFKGNSDEAVNMYTSWVFFSGLLDIFVAYMMYFTFVEKEDTPDFLTDENHRITYPVLDVIIGEVELAKF
jgi:hypothetical protein